MAGLAPEAINGYLDFKNIAEGGTSTNKTTSALTGGAKGAALGAKLGTVAGPLGTAIGAGVGLLGGVTAGIVGANKAQEAQDNAITDEYRSSAAKLQQREFAHGGSLKSKPSERYTRFVDTNTSNPYMSGGYTNQYNTGSFLQGPPGKNPPVNPGSYNPGSETYNPTQYRGVPAPYVDPRVARSPVQNLNIQSADYNPEVQARSAEIGGVQYTPNDVGTFAGRTLRSTGQALGEAGQATGQALSKAGRVAGQAAKGAGKGLAESYGNILRLAPAISNYNQLSSLGDRAERTTLARARNQYTPDYADEQGYC